MPFTCPMKKNCQIMYYVFIFTILQPNSLFRGGPTLTTFVCLLFLVDEVRDDPNTTRSWPLSTRQRKAIQMLFRWWADGGPALNASLGIWTSIAKTPYIFVIVHGGGVRTPPPSGSAHGLYIHLRKGYSEVQYSFCDELYERLLHPSICTIFQEI